MVLVKKMTSTNMIMEGSDAGNNDHYDDMYFENEEDDYEDYD